MVIFRIEENGSSFPNILEKCEKISIHRVKISFVNTVRRKGRYLNSYKYTDGMER